MLVLQECNKNHHFPLLETSLGCEDVPIVFTEASHHFGSTQVVPNDGILHIFRNALRQIFAYVCKKYLSFHMLSLTATCKIILDEIQKVNKA